MTLTMYAGAGMWDKAKQVRETMSALGIKKIPGIVNVTVKSFNETTPKARWVANNTDHKEYSLIEKTLMNMFALLKNNGYVVDRRWLLQESDNPDECFHSEMLAIAWALVNSPTHTAIFLSKNLRICGNCHEASKLVSVLYGRDIYARDANRHHHFSDGKCSCGGYW